MKLYRITWEADNGYELYRHYEYLIGNRALGKAIAWGLKDDDTLIDVIQLQPTWEAFKVCAQHTHSSCANQCVQGGRCY